MFGLTSVGGSVTVSAGVSDILPVTFASSAFGGGCAQLNITNNIVVASGQYNIRGVSISHLNAVGGSVQVSSSQGAVAYVTLLSENAVGLIVAGDVHVYIPNSGGSNTISNVMLSPVSSVGGSVVIDASQGTIANTTLTGGSNQLRIRGSVQLLTESSNGQIYIFSATNVAAITNGVAINCVSNSIRYVSINGTTANPLTTGPIALSGSNAQYYGINNVVFGSLALVNGSVSLQGQGTPVRSTVFNAADAFGNSPVLTITGDVSIGASGQQTGNVGPIVFNNIGLIGGSVSYFTTPSSAVSSNPKIISFAGAASYLAIVGSLTMATQGNPSQQVTFANLTSIGSVGTSTKLDGYVPYNGLTSIPLQIDGYVYPVLPIGQHYVSTDATDWYCTNHCQGRGVTNITDGKCSATCMCFPGNSGPLCNVSTVCASDCNSCCGQWSAWAFVQSGQTAQNRTRTCPTSLTSCATVQTAGSVVCNASQYQSGGATLTSFATCMSLTSCNASQYQTAAPVANGQGVYVSNRQCAALTVCTPSQYQSVAATVSTDRACAHLTNCTPNQYQSVAPTASTDRSCSDISPECAPYIQYQSAPATLTSNRVCTNTTACAYNAFLVQQPTSTTDRVCLTDYCYSESACLHGGTCINLASSAFCICPTLWTGSQCETAVPDPCSKSPCVHGDCHAISGTSYACACSDGWQGQNCTSKITDSSVIKCDSDPCNSGICYTSAGDGLACLCPPNVFGAFCGSSPCDGMTCENGGECVALSAKQSFCVCNGTYFGSACQYDSDACATMPCQNDATCSTVAGGIFACQCAPGYYSYDCSLASTNACDFAPCGDHGTCSVVGNANYECTCDVGWTGTDCSTVVAITPLGSKSSGGNIGAIAGGAGGGGALLLLLILLVVFLRRRLYIIIS